MEEFDIISINTLTGYVKVKCLNNNTINDIIKKALNDDYDWTFFGLQVEEKHRKFFNRRRFLCPKLQWCHIKILLAMDDVYLIIRAYPLDIDTAIGSSLLTVRYLAAQIKDQYGLMLNEIKNLELALDVACLLHWKDLKSIDNSKSSVDVKSILPTIVLDKIKFKHLKKLIQPKIAEIECLSEKDILKRVLSTFHRVFEFDKDEFKCCLGAGEGIPVNVVLGPKIDICLLVGSSNERRVIAYFSKIDAIHVVMAECGGGVCQIKLLMVNSGASDSLVFTFDSQNIEEADNFVHLIDAYTGYNRMRTSCPMIQIKCPNEIIDIPEIDKSRVRRVKILDSGQFGDVYKGIMRNPSGQDVDVAIKLCKAESTNEDRRLFLAEAEIMRHLEHPHLVQLIGISKDEESWIVMEYCNYGQLLSYLIDNGSDITDLILIAFCYQIATALAYMESKRFLHRDIAARNILVESPECVKLSDFGKAVYLGDEQIYQGGQEKLPVKWAAIECLSHRIFSFASDVWSFGICMWEIISRGMKPYAELSNNEVYTVLKENKRLPKLPMCPDSLHTLFMACWLPDPQKRPAFTTIKNKLNDIKIEIKKIQAEDRGVSMMTGLNRKPPIKPVFGSGKVRKGNDHFTVNQSMPDLLHGSISNNIGRTRHNQNTIGAYRKHSAFATSSSQDGSRSTLTFSNNVEYAVENFKMKTENFIQIISASGTCSVLQLKGFGLTIRHFLLELQREIQSHPLEHQLTKEESALIQMFKSLIRIRVTEGLSQMEMVDQIVTVCCQMKEQTDRIHVGIIEYLQEAAVPH